MPHRTAAMAIGVEKVRARRRRAGCFRDHRTRSCRPGVAPTSKPGSRPTGRCSRARHHGGRRPMASKRCLFTFDNTTLELVSPKANTVSAGTESADRIRTVIDAQGEGLARICFRTNDIARMHRRLTGLRSKPTPVGEAESRDIILARRCSGSGPARKPARRAASGCSFLNAPTNGRYRRCQLSAPITAMGSCRGLDRRSEGAAALYGARLGLDMALDRSHPDWGRLMFFRCGDLVVEVGASIPQRHRRGARPAPGPVLARWRMRMRRVSGWCPRHRCVRYPHRRKPGTRVMTVRSGTCGVPTLLVERTPRPDRTP